MGSLLKLLISTNQEVERKGFLIKISNEGKLVEVRYEKKFCFSTRKAYFSYIRCKVISNVGFKVQPKFIWCCLIMPWAF